RGTTYLIVDGGLHHQLAASGNFGQVIRRNYPLAIGNRMGQPPDEVVSVVGCLCTPLDLLGDKVALPASDIGHLVGIFQAGAYRLTASPTAFLSHPEPVEVLVRTRRSARLSLASHTTVTRVVKLLTTMLGIEDRAASIDESTALFGSLPELDSMGVVELISALETEFGFEVDDAEITGEVFETVGTLADFVDSKVAVGGEGAPAP